MYFFSGVHILRILGYCLKELRHKPNRIEMCGRSLKEINPFKVCSLQQIVHKNVIEQGLLF